MNNLLGIPVPIYCESSGILALFPEPLNAVSNMAFIFAGLGIYKLLTKDKIQKVEYKIALVLIFFVGFDSFLWHITKHPIGLILDAVPITLTFILITYILLKNIFGNKLIALIIPLLLFPVRFFLSSFALTDIASSLIRHSINVITFFIIILLTFRKYGKIALEGLGVLSVYLTAIIMRTIDLQICQYFPLGTHFLWHILNAFSLYLAIKFLIKLERIS